MTLKPAVMNMSEGERLAGVMGGGLLAVYGVCRRDPLGTALALVGSTVAWAGLYGHLDLYDRLGVHRFSGEGSAANAVSGQAARVERHVEVNRPVHEVYEFWRNFENLPRFMPNLVSVDPIEPGLYRWVARAPFGTVAWNARIIDEQVPWLISWTSVPGSRIDNAGSVWFSPAAGGHGTDVRVNLAYKPPAGPVGLLLARLFGKDPSLQVRDDLWRFKHIMEDGDSIDEIDEPRGTLVPTMTEAASGAG
jgi:uncharacterized membrane protein